MTSLHNMLSMSAALPLMLSATYGCEPATSQFAYRNLSYYHQVDRGGHFAAWEQPELFASELRAAFKALRRPQ